MDSRLSSEINARWPLPRNPRVRPAVPLPWYPPATAAGMVLLRHPRLFSALAPLSLASYAGASLKLSERELVTLRTTWNAAGYYEWGLHAGLQHALGRDWAWLRRVARGPEALGWKPRQVALLQAADELYAGQVVTDETWQRLYFLTPRQRIEVCLLTGMHDAAAMLFGSLGVPYDGWSLKPLRLASPPEWTAPVQLLRGSGGGPAPIPVRHGAEPAIPWLPRSPQARKLLAAHPRLPSALRFFAHRMSGKLTFTGERCDLVVLRVLALCGLDRPWAQEEWRLRTTDTDLATRAARGTATDGREAALLQAADELHYGRYVTDATWTELKAFLNTAQLIELLTLVGAFRMLAMTCNTLDGR